MRTYKNTSSLELCCISHGFHKVDSLKVQPDGICPESSEICGVDLNVRRFENYTAKMSSFLSVFVLFSQYKYLNIQISIP